MALWLSSQMVVVPVMGALKTPPRTLAKVESLRGGVCRRVVFSLTSGLGDTCLLLRLVADRSAVECKHVA
jgi:hypothetical protein